MQNNMQNTEILSWDNTKSLNDIALVEMGNNDVILSGGIGKIVLWFGRQATFDDVSNVIQSVARIDTSVEHEKEVICSCSEISQCGDQGCIITSYARHRGGGYRVIFTIPLCNSQARTYFINSIIKELTDGDVKKTLHWNGSIVKVMLLFDELKKLLNLKLLNVEYKEETDA